MRQKLQILALLLGLLLVLAGCGGSTSTPTSGTTPTVPTSIPTGTIPPVITPTATPSVTVTPSTNGTSTFCVSTHLDSSALTDADRGHQMDLMEAAGIKWIRVEFERSRVNPSKNEWDFSRYDTIFSLASARGISVIALVDATDAPDWLYSQNTPYNWEDLQTPTDYGEFASQVAGRYGSRALYELMNEPDLVGSPHLSQVAMAARFVALLKAGYLAVKQANPALQVISGGISNANPIPFVQAMYNNGVQGYFDYFGFHPYSQPNPPSFSNLAAIQAIMGSHGDGGKKIIITEVGWPTGSSDESVSEQMQAQYLTTFYQALSSYNVPIACWYEFQDGGTDATNPEDNFGLVRSDYSLKPSYRAMKSIATK